MKRLLTFIVLCISVASAQKTGQSFESPVTLIKPNHVTEYYNTIQGAIDAAPDTSIVNISPAVYLMVNRDTSQIKIIGKNNLTINGGGAIIKKKNVLNEVHNITIGIDIVGSTNITISDLSLDGNFANQVGESWLVGDGSAAIRVTNNGTNSSRNITFKNIRVDRWNGDAFWIQYCDNFHLYDCQMDSVGEGILMYYSTNGIVRDPSIGRIINQDGIEPSNCKNVLIDHITLMPLAYAGPSNTIVDIYFSQEVTVSNSDIRGVDHAVQTFSSRNIRWGPNNFITGTLSESFYSPPDTSFYIFESTFEDTVGFGPLGETRRAFYILRNNDTSNADVYIRNCKFIGDRGIYGIGNMNGVHIEGCTFTPKTVGASGFGIELENYGAFIPNGIQISNNHFLQLQNGIYLNTPTLDTGSVVNNTFWRCGTKVANPNLIPTTSTFWMYNNQETKFLPFATINTTTTPQSFDLTDIRTVNGLNPDRFTTRSDVQMSGTEIVQNGTFDDTTHWNVQTSWVISGGVAHWGGTTNKTISQTYVTPFTSTEAYQLKFTISNCADSSLVLVSTGSGSQYTVVLVWVHDGMYTYNFSNNSGSTIQFLAGGGSVFDLDDVSIKCISLARHNDIVTYDTSSHKWVNTDSLKIRTISVDELLHLKPYTGTPSAPSSGGYFYTHSGGGVAPDTLFWIDSQTTIKQIAP